MSLGQLRSCSGIGKALLPSLPTVQVHRLDILSHPYMRREELLGAKLLSLYTAYKKRQGAGIIQFYSDRLIGLEDALLQTRHQVLAMAVVLSNLLSEATSK